VTVGGVLSCIFFVLGKSGCLNRAEGRLTVFVIVSYGVEVTKESEEMRIITTNERFGSIMLIGGFFGLKS